MDGITVQVVLDSTGVLNSNDWCAGPIYNRMHEASGNELVMSNDLFIPTRVGIESLKATSLALNHHSAFLHPRHQEEVDRRCGDPGSRGGRRPTLQVSREFVEGG